MKHFVLKKKIENTKISVFGKMQQVERKKIMLEKIVNQIDIKIFFKWHNDFQANGTEHNDTE